MIALFLDRDDADLLADILEQVLEDYRLTEDEAEFINVVLDELD